MALTSRTFLEVAAQTLTARIGGAAQIRVRPSMLQAWFESPRQHYEIWLQPKAGLIELGLHFEGPREDSLRRAAAVAEAMPLVVGGLGPHVELEEWTESWTRVHETIAWRTLDETFAHELAVRLAAYVDTLEPIVASLGPVPTPQAAAPTARGSWRRPRARSARRPA